MEERCIIGEREKIEKKGGEASSTHIMSYAPQTMHGVVAHSWMWNLPSFSRLYMVKNVATS